MRYLVILSVFFPIVCGAALLAWRPFERRTRNFLALTVVCVNSLLVLAAVFCAYRFGPGSMSVELLSLGRKLSIALSIDGAGMVFASMIALLWPITTVYAFSYMEHEGRENMFFGFFTTSYGVVAGIAFAANLFTLYLFYELMTLSTLPLVMHHMDAKAKSAGKKYLIYSVGGAALAFIAIVYLMSFGSLDFVFGGTLDASKAAGRESELLIAFVLAFFGFGVKAGIFPLHNWLPSASVAPTPVTALLHAVAVVKSGVFAVMRVTHYCFGASFIAGTAAQSIVMAFAAATAVFGAVKALACPHLKRRLAYLTIGSLGYILFAISILSQQAMAGGLFYMLSHAVVKICLFFAAGAILHCSGREYVRDLEGFGRIMPVTCGCFLVSALGLMAIPPLACFIGKWTIATAAVALGHPIAIAGAAGLALSTALTVICMVDVLLRFYFPLNGSDTGLSTVHEADRRMTVPMIILAVASLVLAFSSLPLLDFLSRLGLMI